MGIPLELPEIYVTECLKEYGEISGNFFVKKRMYNVVYKNGVRVYQFRKLTKDIPEFIQIMGNRTKVIYTGKKKREKAPYVNVLNQQRAINEATCSKDAEPNDLGKTIAKNDQTLAIEAASKAAETSTEEGELQSTKLVIDLEVQSKKVSDKDLEMSNDESDNISEKKKNEIQKKQEKMV